MLDIKRIRNNPEELKAALIKRNKTDIDVDALLALDEARRAAMAEVETLKARRNADSAQVPKLKKQGEDVSALLSEMKEDVYKRQVFVQHGSSPFLSCLIAIHSTCIALLV